MVPEKQIEELVKRLREAGGDNLLSAIIFGSAARGDFHPEFSNVNIFCAVRDNSFSALQALSPAVTWWNRQKQPTPLFMTPEELDRSVDVFTIELMDMQQHHRVVYGDDVLQRLTIPATFHRIQVEYELREKLLLLRQHLLSAMGNDREMWGLLTTSVSSFVTLFRHALIVLGHPVPPTKREVVLELSKRLAFDPAGFLNVLDMREGKAERKKVNPHEVFSLYLTAVERVTASVDKMLDSQRS